MVNAELKNMYCGFGIPKCECSKSEFLGILFSLSFSSDIPIFLLPCIQTSSVLSGCLFIGPFFQPNQGIDLG